MYACAASNITLAAFSMRNFSKIFAAYLLESNLNICRNDFSNASNDKVIHYQFLIINHRPSMKPYLAGAVFTASGEEGAKPDTALAPKARAARVRSGAIFLVVCVLGSSSSFHDAFSFLSIIISPLLKKPNPPCKRHVPSLLAQSQ
jgi:hypothetical protein